MRRAHPNLLLAALLSSSALFAQGAPRLVKDIVTQRRYGGGSNPQPGVSVGGVACFPAFQGSMGREMWWSDGTTAGTRLPAEIIPGPGPYWLPGGGMPATYGGRACYSDGADLWLSDGTVAGTQPIRGLPWGDFVEVVELGGFAYVSARDRNGAAGLWRTNFTPTGTNLIRAFVVPPHHLTVVGAQVLFFGTDAATGTEPWRAAGTTASLVLDIWPNQTSSIFLDWQDKTRLPVTPGGLMFFPAHDGASGVELWCSDGTAAGTHLVLDIFPGVGSGFAWVGEWGPALLGNNVVFAATDGTSGAEPWISNGTATGTRRIKRLGAPNTSSSPVGFTSLATASGPVVCFWADDGVVGLEPWVTDGTGAGTMLLRDITPWSAGGPPARAVVNGKIVFSAGDYLTGLELWGTDGTPGGTTLIRDIRPGYQDSAPTPVALTANGLLLAADDGVHGVELWRTDGTTGGTVLVRDLEPDLPGTELAMPMTLGDRLLFSGDGDLWRSDATANGTVRLRSAGYRFVWDRVAAGLTAAVLFIGEDSTNGRELWRSDGTTAGTALVRDINPGGSAFGVSYDDTAVNLAPDLVVFGADDGTNGRQLWRTDGTTAGTQPVTSLVWSGPYWLTVIEPAGSDRVVLFAADDRIAGYELWRSDGTTAGTALVKDIWPGPIGSHDDERMLAMGPFALLAASDGVSGFELWRSDGTAAGTYLVKDIQPGPGSSNPILRDALVIGGVAYFVADDGISGRELWKSDGTTAGTSRVADLWPGAPPSDPAQLTELAGALLFSADDGSSGRELWHTTGTLTRRLTDLRPGPKSSLAATGDGGFVFAPPGARRALFTASDGSSPGLQLWSTDGTTVALHHAGSYGDGWGQWPALAGTKLYVPVWDATTGHELWAMRSMAAAVPFGFGCRAGNGWPTLRGTGPVLGTNCDLQISPSPAVAAFALDGARTDIPLGGGCTLYLPTLAIVVPSTNGHWQIPVPNVPAFNGRQLFAQAAQYDVVRGTIVWTNGLQLVLATE